MMVPTRKLLIGILSLVYVLFSGVILYPTSVIPVQGAAWKKIELVDQQTLAKVSPQVLNSLQYLQDHEKTTVIVTFKEQAQLERTSLGKNESWRRQLLQQLRSRSEQTQTSLKPQLETWRTQGLIERITYYWIFNGMAVTAPADIILKVAAMPEVEQVTPNQVFTSPVSPQTSLTASTNLDMIGIFSLWNMGFMGNGIVIASMDTGVDGSHPDLAEKWRGGNNSWYDPYGEHPDVPVDKNGHGTWTMGVMVGGNQSGTSIGIAPEAQWIAVRIFNDQGVASTEEIHKAFQWLIDPDGDPNTDDAPDVLNNSWSFETSGCYLDFQADLQALRSAGILPIFAAGNTGPESSTGVSPANNPEAFAVGAIDSAGEVYINSSRGPTACGEPQTTFPKVVAPGVDILSSGLYEGYSQSTGTSLAAPHAAGVLALLLQAYPDLNVEQQEEILIESAVDLGETGPDDSFGYGRIDALAAYQLLSGSGTPPVVPGVPIPDTSSRPMTLHLPLLVSGYSLDSDTR